MHHLVLGCSRETARVQCTVNAAGAGRQHTSRRLSDHGAADCARQHVKDNSHSVQGTASVQVACGRGHTGVYGCGHTGAAHASAYHMHPHSPSTELCLDDSCHKRSVPWQPACVCVHAVRMYVLQYHSPAWTNNNTNALTLPSCDWRQSVTAQNPTRDMTSSLTHASACTLIHLVPLNTSSFLSTCKARLASST